MFGFTFNLYGPTCERDKLLKNGWKCDFTKQALASTAKAEYNRILLWHHWHKSKSTNSDHCDREALSPEVSLQSSPVSSQKTYDFEGSHRWPGWPWRVACRHPRWPNSDLLSLPTSAASCQHHAKRCCAFAVFSHRFSFRNHCAIIVAEYGLSWFIPVVPSSKSKTSSCRPAAAAHAGLMPRKRCARWTECDQSPVEASTFQGLSTVQPVSMEFWLRSRPSVDFVKFASWQRKFTSRSFKRTHCWEVFFSRKNCSVAESKSWWFGLELASSQLLFLSASMPFGHSSATLAVGLSTMYFYVQGFQPSENQSVNLFATVPPIAAVQVQDHRCSSTAPKSSSCVHRWNQTNAGPSLRKDLHQRGARVQAEHVPSHVPIHLLPL